MLLATEAAPEIYIENSKRPGWPSKYRSHTVKMTPAERSKLWRKENREKLKAQKKRYEARHPDRIRASRRKQIKKPRNRLLRNLRKRTHRMISRITGTGPTSKLTGMPTMLFRQWIEAQFTSDMSWDNYGTFWVLDHILPCSVFDQSNLWQRSLCWNWQNLRPLERKQNEIKSNKLVTAQLPLPLSFHYDI